MFQGKPLPAVIILAAGSTKGKYQNHVFAYKNAALVPIASRSTLSLILDFYVLHKTSIYIAINQDEVDIFQQEFSYYKDVQFILVKNSGGVSDTLFQAISQIDETDIIINLTTTIPTLYPPINSVFFDQKLSQGDYSGVIFEKMCPIFVTKKTPTNKSFYAFQGIFRTERKDILKIFPLLEHRKDLLEIVILLHRKKELDFIYSDWIDTGHDINYPDARRKLISSRSFNFISVEPQLGVLSKKSRDVQKLSNEIVYKSMLPEELQIFYPRILSFDALGGLAKMEYYGYPNLSEYQLYWSLTRFKWIKIFQNIYFVLELMRKHTFSVGRLAFEALYIQKTFNRIHSYLSSLSPEDSFNKGSQFYINGEVCFNFSQIQPKIIEKVKSLYNENDFCIMHGDFCFNNILFDTMSDTIKLVDPRGSFGESCVGIYGDFKYDLAKLLHSSVGNYDYIVNNLFQMEEQGNRFNYSFPTRSNQSFIEKLSYDLLKKFNINKKDILFIMGLLFLSMCPLHADDQRKQKLMYLHGIFFVNKYLK